MHFSARLKETRRPFEWRLFETARIAALAVGGVIALALLAERFR
jgi:hypothetical protein